MAFQHDFGPGKSITPYSALSGFAYTPMPVQKWIPVTLDAVFIDPVTGANCSRWVTCSVAGNITLEFADTTSATVPFLASVWYEVKAFKVKSAGTTATGILWGY